MPRYVRMSVVLVLMMIPLAVPQGASACRVGLTPAGAEAATGESTPFALAPDLPPVYKPNPQDPCDIDNNPFWRDFAAWQDRQLSNLPGGSPVGQVPQNTGPPTISGIPVEGETLTSSDGSWSDPGPRAYVYQWRRCDPELTTCSEIVGARGKTYTTTSADVGDALDVRVRAGNAAGFSSFSSPSTRTAPIANATNDPAGDAVQSTEEPGGNNVEACGPDAEDPDQSPCLAVSSAQGKVYYVGSSAGRCRTYLGGTQATIVDGRTGRRYGSNGKLSRKKGNFLRICSGIYGAVQSFKPNSERSAGTFREGGGSGALVGNTYSRRKVYAGCTQEEGAGQLTFVGRVRCQYDY